MRHGARNIGISNERRRERVPSGRTSEDTYEMSDDDLVSKKTGAQVLVGPTSTRYEGSTHVGSSSGRGRVFASCTQNLTNNEEHSISRTHEYVMQYQG